jgi:hypothetical protein
MGYVLSLLYPRHLPARMRVGLSRTRMTARYESVELDAGWLHAWDWSCKGDDIGETLTPPVLPLVEVTEAKLAETCYSVVGDGESGD